MVCNNSLHLKAPQHLQKWDQKMPARQSRGLNWFFRNDLLIHWYRFETQHMANPRFLVLQKKKKLTETDRLGASNGRVQLTAEPRPPPQPQVAPEKKKRKTAAIRCPLGQQYSPTPTWASLRVCQRFPPALSLWILLASRLSLPLSPSRAGAGV